MERFNLRVMIKEPRGFVRLLQILFSTLAYYTTAGFATTSTLHIDCPDATPYTVEYKIAYPFDLRHVEVLAPYNCTDDVPVVQETFPIDFSSTAMLYVLICTVSQLYAIASLVYYCLFTLKYENDPLAPMVDLCITFAFTLFWFLITCIWALNVSDLKHYTHPHQLKRELPVCDDQNGDVNCQTSNPGKWSSLTVSIVCGFTCVVLWLGSTWFIFKETTLHKKQANYQQGPVATTSAPSVNTQQQSI